MKAIVQVTYGSPDVLEPREIDTPAVKDDEVLVRVHAAALHAGDYFIMRGVPMTEAGEAILERLPSSNDEGRTRS